MKIEEFVELYSSEYILNFKKEEVEVVEERVEKKSTLSKISDFLFEPRYEVNNLKFTIVEAA